MALIQEPITSAIKPSDENTAPADTLTAALQRAQQAICRLAPHKNCEIRNIYCYKPQILW